MTEPLKKSVEAFLEERKNRTLLRISTAGSVDDGKSTLIGRLLHDSKNLFEDHLSNLKKTAGTGNAGEHIDFASITDGLKAEQEQGITIDVAYRYFATPKRSFILADTPGHVQYTRNMATGASTADVAIILIDARHGVLTQTRRHSFIASLLGIPRMLVTVNKMDLKEFDQKVFDDIVAEYKAFAAVAGIKEMDFIPVSALLGDNVVDTSTNMPWYTGPSLMHYLEECTVRPPVEAGLRFPVQYVIRPNQNFRGFAGTIRSGSVRVGDKVKILPEEKTSTIDKISTFDGDPSEAVSGQAVTLTLKDEIDISRGDMIFHPDEAPLKLNDIRARLVWMNEKAGRRGSPWVIRHTTRETRGWLAEIHHLINCDTLEKDKADEFVLNDIGEVTIHTNQPLFCDPYMDNRATGSFILIDPISNDTIAAGMIVGEGEGSSQGGTGRLKSSARIIDGDDPTNREARANTMARAFLDEGLFSVVITEDMLAPMNPDSLRRWLTGLGGKGAASFGVQLLFAGGSEASLQEVLKEAGIPLLPASPETSSKGAGTRAPEATT